MLHLAQVQAQTLAGKVGLQLLAQQVADNTWIVLPERSDKTLIFLTEAESLSEGLLVLVEISEGCQPQNVRVAAPWVLEVIAQFLASGITPDFLKREAEQAEQWRQELTLKSQDLARRTLELEARRATIQTLEEDLKVQKQHLDDMLQALIAREKDIQNREEELRIGLDSSNQNEQKPKLESRDEPKEADDESAG